MNIEILEKHGIPGQVIKRWKSSGMKYLLPIQAECVNGYGILDGKSVVINGPGTSGKTFCGEMAAIRNAVLGRKSVFLVPLKAIAEEKYRLFKSRYSPLGIRVAMATRDHIDRNISRGEYDILISVYEKFNSLTATDISLLRNTGCFILDEFQMISNDERGLVLELLIAKIRAFNPRSQLVVLMGEGSFPRDVSEWLKIPCIEENRRPVDLRLGILHRGTFHFRGFNDLREGEEFWLERRESGYEGPFNDQAVAAMEALIGKGEQVIVFCSSKNGCVKLAEHLAENLNLPGAAECLKNIDEIPPSIQNERLARSLYGGVAFHHAELDSDQRALVEDGFRSGEIRALVSTTTLAWGVNLPAKNVFIEMMKYGGRKSSNGSPMLLPISVTDFQQAAGRAGRLGSEDDFGRAVMTASTPYEHEILWERYIYSQNDRLETRVEKSDFIDLVSRLAACGAAGSANQTIAIVSGLYCFRNAENGDDARFLVFSAIEYLEKEGLLLVEKSGYFRITSFGETAGSSGLSVATCVRIASAIGEGEIIEPLEALFFSFELKEWAEQAGFYSRANISQDNLLDRLSYLTNDIMERSEYFQSYLRRIKSRPVAAMFTACLFALEWINGTPTRDLEALFRRGSGGLRRDANTLSWIIGGIEKIVRCLKSDWPEDKIEEMSALLSRLKYGVDKPMIPLAMKLNIDREFIRRLYDFGIKTENDLYQVDYQAFREILPGSVIAKIAEKAGRLSSENPSSEKMSISDYILFMGETKRRLKEVIIAGRSIFLQPKLYSYLLKLWWGYKSGKQWVNKDSLEPGFNQARYIFKLRRSLREYEGALEIVSDGAGSYRLILPESEDLADIVADDEQIGVNGR